MGLWVLPAPRFPHGFEETMARSTGINRAEKEKAVLGWDGTGAGEGEPHRAEILLQLEQRGVWEPCQGVGSTAFQMTSSSGNQRPSQWVSHQIG